MSCLIRSPYDDEARYSTKRSQKWVGYKVHLTETCHPDRPRLIIHVGTTNATQQDCEVIDHIQDALVARQLRPNIHLVDAGYVDAENLANSRLERAIDLFGPTRPDTSWQAQTEDAFDIMQFEVDWVAQTATCPAGHRSLVWAPGTSQYGCPVIRVHFSPLDCQPCQLRSCCTQGLKRGLTLRPQPVHEVLQSARRRQQSEAFWATHRQRSAIEGTISQTTRVSGMRTSRYAGKDKTHLHCVITAVPINLSRALNWLNEVPLAMTRTSHFAALAPAS